MKAPLTGVPPKQKTMMVRTFKDHEGPVPPGRIGRAAARRLSVLLGSLVLLFSYPAQGQQNINNPVLPGVADAGVLKYNGEYYIGGVFTNGGFYVSPDLKTWQGPVPAFSMNNAWTAGPSADNSQIHANDLNYINGLFHLYWSVNYWGKDRNAIHIGHATSSRVLGPYTEPVKDRWVDNRIDPELFVDEDGQMYLYMVKFTDGNTIWVQPMKDPATPQGQPLYLFASLPNTWETADNRVAEGPWVIRYRGRYYMMYNANHTSTSWGNYMLGVAEAASPLAFNHGNKYPYPVVKSNQADLEDTYVDLLKYGGSKPGMFHYTLEQPPAAWVSPEFGAADWQQGRGGFGSSVVKNSTTRAIGTSWTMPAIWLRRSFVVDKKAVGNLVLRIHHDGDTKVYLNGQAIYEKEGRNHTTWNFDAAAARLLKEGENTLAVHSRQGARTGYLDVSLFDLKEATGDDILFSPGQPNIVQGPNGFEWWLVYMANKNSDRRGQYINRVHFFDKRLYVDGVTASHTPGYHPYPARPTFSDLFQGSGTEALNSKWSLKGGNWLVKDKELVQTGPAPAQALVKSTPARYYLFETGVKLIDTTSAKAGIIAWWKDDDNWLTVSLQQQSCSYTLKQGGRLRTASAPLPRDFIYGAYHKLTVYKNGPTFSVRLDDRPLFPAIAGGGDDKGLPGLFTEGGGAAFDGTLYTIGWDEYDEGIRGWEERDAHSTAATGWIPSAEGLGASPGAGERSVFKGDPLPAYEFSAQVRMDSLQGRAGIYPVYIDRDNYLQALFEPRSRRLLLSGKVKGKEMSPQAIPMERPQDYYTDMKYTDFFEKHFTFPATVTLNAIRLNKTPLDRPDTLLEDIHEKMAIHYRHKGVWHPLPAYRLERSGHPGFVHLSFEPVEAEALRFTNKEAGDLNFYLNKVWVNEVFRDSYNIRVVKLREEVLLWVDGKEVARIKQAFSPSRVGLVAKDAGATFNGLTLFHLPD